MMEMVVRVVETKIELQVSHTRLGLQPHPSRDFPCGPLALPAARLRGPRPARGFVCAHVPEVTAAASWAAGRLWAGRVAARAPWAEWLRLRLAEASPRRGCT